MSEDNEVVGDDDLSFTAEEQAQFAAIRSEAPSEPVEERSEAAGADAPETAEAAEEAPKGQEKEPLHQAMHQERLRRKKAEEHVRQIELENARLSERTNIILQQLQGYGQKAPQPEPPKGPPNPNEDVFGAVEYLIQNQQASDAKIAAYERQQEQQRQQAQHVNMLTGALRQHEVRAREQVPDYDDAMKFFAEVRARDLQVRGMTDPRAINQEITRQDLEHIDLAMRSRQDPAALAYQRALAYGYQKAAPAAEQPRAPDGKFASADLSRVAAGQAASKTLAGGGAREGGAVIDAKALAAMNEDEFQEFAAKNPRAYARLFGRDAA